MSDDDNFTDGTDGGEGIKNLRKQYADTQKELKAALDELNSFRAAQRRESAADVFKAKGLDEAKAKAAAKLYSGEDVSEDAVGKWLDEYRDLFPVTQGSTENDANANNAARVAAASHGTADASGTGTTPVALGDPFEIARLLETLPYDEQVKVLGMPPRGSI